HDGGQQTHDGGQQTHGCPRRQGDTLHAPSPKRRAWSGYWNERPRTLPSGRVTEINCPPYEPSRSGCSRTMTLSPGCTTLVDHPARCCWPTPPSSSDHSL